MTHTIIINQGRVADRTSGALGGALIAGEALGQLLSVSPVVVSSPSPAQVDDWSEALPAAQATLTELRQVLSAALDAGTAPVLATNTCAASLATLPEVAERYPDAVVLWIDAHADFHTPDTTESGYLGGMVLAAGCGLWQSGHGAGLNPHQVALVGARDIDPAEQALLAEAGVRVFSPADSTPEAVAEFVAGRDVWIHVDWDVLTPGYIPAAYKIPEGLRPHQIGAIFAALSSSIVRGVEFAEFEASDPDIPQHLSVELILETFQQLRV